MVNGEWLVDFRWLLQFSTRVDDRCAFEMWNLQSPICNLQLNRKSKIVNRKFLIDSSFIIHYFRPMEHVQTRFRRILFIHKVAFICNIFFLLCMVIRYSHADTVIPQPIVELTTILGWLFSPAINLICLCVSFVVVLKRGKAVSVPLWLIVANLIFFVVQIFYFFLSWYTRFLKTNQPNFFLASRLSL